MAKKRREWKAWMVMDKRGVNRTVHTYKKWAWAREKTDRIIRVRIVEA